ncbi:MAG: hypothetical protein MI919_42995, partial [Holophagales bacterium]|nr:hypothetical protein [Holophagales bacterium]
GLATAADGDPETARLWAELRVALPSSPGPSYRTAAGHAPSIAMADLVAMLLLAEIQVDRAALAGDELWVRGLMTHLAVASHLEKVKDGSREDLDLMYRSLLGQRGKKALAASDYRAEISTRDWLWFQAALHSGAAILEDDEGRGLWKRMKKLRERAGGVLTGASILDRYDSMSAWYHETFAPFSTRPLD